MFLAAQVQLLGLTMGIQQTLAGQHWLLLAMALLEHLREQAHHMLELPLWLIQVLIQRLLGRFRLVLATYSQIPITQLASLW